MRILRLISEERLLDLEAFRNPQHLNNQNSLNVFI